MASPQAQEETEHENGSTSVLPQQQQQQQEFPTSAAATSTATTAKVDTVSRSESEEIASALDRRNRHRQSFSSFFHSYQQPSHPSLPQSTTIPEDAVEDDDADDAEEIEKMMNGLREEFDLYHKENQEDKITILQNQRLDAGTARQIDLDDVEEDVESEFVWDVLFENQRGIYLLGTGYFSSKTLLPADPSPFTKPPTALASASSLSKRGKYNGARHWSSLHQPDQDDTQAEASSSATNHNDVEEPSNPSIFDRKGKAKARQDQIRYSQSLSQRVNESITTGYTLTTFQPPSPKWVYITPWMINMRVGTDESGWRYNAWFKRKGWASHAGFAGWGGWVRRREWVRLRYIGPQTLPAGAVEETYSKDLNGSIGQKDREVFETTPKGLMDVFISDKVDGNVQSVLKIMAKLPLDRERLVTWRKWLDKKEDRKSPAWHRLAALASDEQALDHLRRQFTYQSNFPPFLKLLASHGIEISHSHAECLGQIDESSDSISTTIHTFPSSAS